MTVEAELKRRNDVAALVDWLLATDPDNPATGLSDPVVDFGARAALAAILTELGQKLEAGQAVALDGPTLAALESVTATVVDWPADFPDADAQALLTAIAAALAGTLDVSGTVALDAPTLAALETINTTVTNWPADFPLPAAQVTALTPQTDALTDAELRAVPVPVSGTVSVNEPVTVDGTVSSGEKYDLLPYAQQLTASDTITPSTGKRLQVVWVQVIPDPDATEGNLVTVGFDGGTTLYRVYALGRSAVFVGDVDQALTIDLENAQPVTVNIHYRELP